jgi:extracellular factor (EF) 3-hydroxypalmitic acid methyl ester biosynthesis protein
MNTLTIESRRLFDRVYDQLINYRVGEGMLDLTQGLFSLRRSAQPKKWREFARSDWQEHPLKQLAHQDPITRRAYEKPRGYAGDAELLDYIYGLRMMPNDTTCLGAAIYSFILQAPGPRAVRARRDLLASYIDAVATRIDKPRILAVACGHLREAQKSVTVREGRIGRFIALDQDRDSLAVVKGEQEADGVEAIHGSVNSILEGETIFEDLDFVYSTGLYDYLPQPVAIDLTTKLFGMLKPAGRLLIANFLRDVPDVGYMESFMGWPLIYRGDEELAGVTQGIPAKQIAAQRTFHDRFENVVFLEVEKR